MKTFFFICIFFIQNITIAQVNDSKLMVLNKRKEIKSDLNPEFFLEIRKIYPNFNDNELLIIDFYPENEKCILRLGEEEIQKYSLDFQQKVNEVTQKKSRSIVENELSIESQNDFMSTIINKFLLNKSYHCYNRILIYKDKYIALLGDYNDDEALQRIKKLIK